MNELLERQVAADRSGQAYATATIVDTAGSTARSYGKLLVLEDGSSFGTIGGGIAELRAKKDALACIQSGQNLLKHYEVETSLAGEGLTCFGGLTVFIEVFCAKPLLVVCGGGHVGASLMRIAKLTGFELLLFDDRSEELIAEAVQLADRFVRVSSFDADVAAYDIRPGAYFVVCGHSHLQDGDALKAALGKEAAYVGMLGSQKKIRALFDRLRGQGISEEQLRAVYTPIGLNVGGETPQELAVGILAQILMVRNGVRQPAET